LTHHAIGRLHPQVAADDAKGPAAADVHLFTHAAGFGPVAPLHGPTVKYCHHV
jgi:hypothetical protein